MIIVTTETRVRRDLEETKFHLTVGTDKRQGNTFQDSPCSSRDLNPAPP